MANKQIWVSLSPARPHGKHIVIAGIGAFLAILALMLLQAALDLPWLMASFGASCLIVFALPDSPLAQPRNVIGGHALAAAAGLLVAEAFGVSMWSMALAVALAIMVMLWTRTPHPPAGANPLIVMMGGTSWDFLLFPVLSGALVLVAVACLVHKSHRVAYPKYWF